MLSSNPNKSFLIRSLSLAKVLWFGVAWMRASFIAVCCLWVLVFLVDYATPSAQVVVSVMTAPIILQTLLAMYIGMRASQIIMNSQLHLMGLRKELFLNCLFVCVLFTLFVYDPKSSDNLLTAKLLVFVIISAVIPWLCWMYCLQVVPIFIMITLMICGFGLVFLINAQCGLVFFSIAMWSYFAYWLLRSPLQRQFKFETFAGFVDYSVERLNINFLKRALTLVRTKEHVLLMGEGDGYLNRILLAPIFSLASVFLYVVFMQSMPGLCLWMILMQLLGTKAKAKVLQSPAKLWLLSASDRHGLFAKAENIVLRLNLYPFIGASVLVLFWSMINPHVWLHGLSALSLSLLFIIAVDYWVGMVEPVGKVSVLIPMLSKMLFMVLMINIHLNLVGYLFLVALLLVCCLLCRKRAQRQFLVANLSRANSPMRAS